MKTATFRPATGSTRLIDSEAVAFADWQGLAYPAQWGAAEIAGLLESLHAVNHHSLAAIVAELTSD